MSARSSYRQLRAIAVNSRTLRGVATKVLGRVPATATGANASSWAIRKDDLADLESRYRGSFPVSPVSYGTVRDFAESTEQMPGLAGANFDMKDLQRSWMLKAIVGNVAGGGRLLEIGAGEPLVAGALSRLGYDVTVVDPYDGSGNGPREFESFRGAYPDLRFVREQFPPQADVGGSFDAIYSISVLEHVPLETLDAVTSGARSLLREGGLSIHAVDHVLTGWGAEEHLAKLRAIAAGMGIDLDRLEEALGRLADDPETYFVSAEAHNRWRGDLPYDQYPMRRIVSVNLFAPV